jgi:hypothetical protein
MLYRLTLAVAAILSLAACGNSLTPRDRAMLGLPQNYAPPSYCGSFTTPLDDPYCHPPPPPGWTLSGTVPIDAPSNVTEAPATTGRSGHFMSSQDKQRWIANCARAAEGNLPWCIRTSTNW